MYTYLCKTCELLPYFLHEMRPSTYRKKFRPSAPVLYHKYVHLRVKSPYANGNSNDFTRSGTKK